jgi:hypothetical protein
MFDQVNGVAPQHHQQMGVIPLQQHRLTRIYLENIHLAPMDTFQNLPGANFKSKYHELHGEDRLPTVYLGKAAPGVGEWGMGLAVIKEKIASDLYYYSERPLSRPSSLKGKRNSFAGLRSFTFFRLHKFSLIAFQAGFGG